MGTKPSKDDGAYAALIPLNGTTTSGRLALTTASAALTSGRLVIGVTYKFSLSTISSDTAWIDLTGGTAVAPAGDAAFTAGFWLNPGEFEIVKASAALCSGIMLSGTGTLLITRFIT